MSSQLREELLAVLRGRCQASCMPQAPNLLRWLENNWRPYAESSIERRPAVLRDLIVDACEKALEHKYLLPVVRAMLGVNLHDSARVTRQRILETMASLMPRHRSGPGDPAYSTRRMEQLERELICPEVHNALRTFLGKSVAPGLYPWHDYDLRVSLRQHKTEKELLTMRTDMEFTARLKHVVLVVTTDEGLADGLCQEFPEITDVFVPSVGWGLERVSVTCRDSREWVPVPLRQLDEVERAEWDAKLDPNSDVEIYVSAHESNYAPKRWRIVSDQEISLLDGYCYWSAARMLELRSMHFDYSSFPDGEDAEFDVKLRLGRSVKVQKDPGLQLVEIQVGSWVSPGNAVELTWQRPAR